MNLTKEQMMIFVLAGAFLTMSFLYFQSQQTIKEMYTESVLESLESSLATSTLTIPSETELEVVPAPETPERPVLPAPIEVSPIPVPDTACYTGGCSSQLCGDASIRDMATTCEWREEYACYKAPIGVCERQSTGQCGWTETEELKACILEARDYSVESEYQVI